MIRSAGDRRRRAGRKLCLPLNPSGRGRGLCILGAAEIVRFEFKWTHVATPSIPLHSSVCHLDSGDDDSAAVLSSFGASFLCILVARHVLLCTTLPSKHITQRYPMNQIVAQAKRLWANHNECSCLLREQRRRGSRLQIIRSAHPQIIPLIK